MQKVFPWTRIFQSMEDEKNNFGLQSIKIVIHWSFYKVNFSFFFIKIEVLEKSSNFSSENVKRRYVNISENFLSPWSKENSFLNLFQSFWKKSFLWTRGL